MDPATATVLAALIGGLGSIAVAFITTRARIGAPAAPLPLDDSPTHENVPHKRSVKRAVFRGIGWTLVGFLYLVAAMFLLFGGTEMTQINIGTSDRAVFSVICIFGLCCFAIAFWAQRRLWRSRRTAG